MAPMHNPAHPGEVLREHLGDRTVTAAAEKLCVTRASLSRVLNGTGRITPELALRLSKATGCSAETWLSMQSSHDLWIAKKSADLRNVRQLKFSVA